MLGRNIIIKNPLMRKCYFVACILLLSFCEIWAIDISRYRFHTIPATHYYHGIMGITKDSIGRIWYNGRDALFMYDGNSFNQMDRYVARLFPRTPWTYKTVFTDKDKRLFVVTDQGLLLFNYSTSQFSQIIDGDVNNSVAQEADGLLWMLRNGRIESFFYSEKAQVTVYPYQAKKGLSGLSHINGYTYFADGDNIYRLNRNMKRPQLFATLNENIRYMRQMIGYQGDFFVLTNPGLYRLDKNGNIKKKYTINNEIPSDLKYLYVDEYGILWVATQNGLLLIDPRTDELVLLQSKLGDMYSLPHNSIWSIYPDADGGIWIGTFGGKLGYLNFIESHIIYKTQLYGQLNNSIVSCFAEDKDNNLWIGTEGGGINVWDRKNDTFSYHTHSDSDGINYDLIKALFFDKGKENIRIAAYNGGIMEYNMSTGRFGDMNIYDPNNYTQQMSVYDFAFEADSGIWVSNPEETLYYKDLKSGKVRQIALVDVNGTILNDISIERIYRDKRGKIWLFSHRGIYVMDVKKKKIEKRYYIKDVPYSVNNLVCFRKTKNSELWVGTMGGGINILKPDGTYENVGVAQGFIPKIVFGIVEDISSNNIWMSTDDGVYYYDREKALFKKVDIFDMERIGSFYPKSCFRTAKGEIVFGGTKGFVLFDPHNIHQNMQEPKVFFTDFQINNNSIKPGNNTILKQDISVMGVNRLSDDRITLSYDQSHIRVYFSCDSYLNSSKNKFAYRLVGGIGYGDWQILPSEQRFVQFSNLTSGSYTLEVKAANNDGVWGKQVSALNFEIKPAPWFSPWALIFYFFLFVSFVVIVYKLYANKRIFDHRLKLEQMKEQKMNELIQLRTDFFTNISHDLKTPLTLIVNPLNQLRNALPDDSSGVKYVHLIERNVIKIQRMISQLLQFREIESKKITLNPQQGNLVKYIRDIFSLFEPYAERKFIATNFATFKQDLVVYFDYDIVEKILFNLISNAIKYSPEGEAVSLNITLASEKDVVSLEKVYSIGKSDVDYVSIEVINTGVEIDEDQKHRLFKSFSRLSDKIPVFESSTGLGLSIVKELVEALNGNIILDSANKRVSFRIVIPFSKVQNKSIEDKSFTYDYTLSELKNIDVNTEENVEGSGRDKRKAYDIVIVEDSADLRIYMEKELSVYYNVYIASNGEEGISLVHRINPQVVITDLMMPKMDGFELSKIMKSDIKTSHIPIIIISALGTLHKVQSLKDGADIFIEKPFDINFLKEQVKNLIKSRELLKERYSKKIVAEPSRVTFSSIDEDLLKKAIGFVEKNIDNPEYNVESFVSDMGGSRTLLYRKINEITGMSIKEFILDMRLKRSAQLLEDTQMTVSEIAYQAGFSDAGYFSVCFKKHYGISPTEFKKKNS